jgi:hypothetical protein
VGHSLTVAAAGERYQCHLKRAGRKRSTIVAVESALRIQLVPFFTDKPLDTIRHQDVVDLVAGLEGKGLSRSRSTTTSGPSRRWSTTPVGRSADGQQ